MLSVMRRLAILFVLLVLLPGSAFAQFTTYLIPEDGILAQGCNFITGEFHFHCFPIYLGYLIQLVFGLLGTICLAMIIWAGYEWSFSGLMGDKEKAKNRLTNALLGLAFSVLSYLIVDTIVGALFS